jgi:hypothetical protein
MSRKRLPEQIEVGITQILLQPPQLLLPPLLHLQLQLLQLLLLLLPHLLPLLHPQLQLLAICRNNSAIAERLLEVLPKKPVKECVRLMALFMTRWQTPLEQGIQVGYPSQMTRNPRPLITRINTFSTKYMAVQERMKNLYTQEQNL